MESQGMDKGQKNIDLGVILSITTHRLYGELDDYYEALRYLTGDPIWSHQIGRVCEQVKPYILSLYPQLEGVGSNEKFNSEEEVFAFVKSQKDVFGDSLPLSPMPKSDGYSYVDPIEEFTEMSSGRSK